jgi:thioredoxin 2
MESILIQCGACGTTNRVLSEKLSRGPVCGKCRAPLKVLSRPVDVTANTFEHEVTEWPGTVLVDFWSPGCGHCSRLSPVLDALAAEKAGSLKIAKVNVEFERELASHFDVRGVPLLLLYTNGRKLGKLPGALPKEQLKSWLWETAGI